MNNVPSGSLLHPLMQQYVALQQAVGRRYHTEQYVLAGLDRFLADHPAMDLTAETFAAWCHTQGHLKPGVSAPSEAWRFLWGGSPHRGRSSQPPVPRVACV